MNEMKTNLTIRDYLKIIEALESAKKELERTAWRADEPMPPEVEELNELIEKVLNVTT